MREVIELLNHCSPARTLFYGIIFLIALALILSAITYIAKTLFLIIIEIVERRKTNEQGKQP